MAMYENYESLLLDLAKEVHWTDHKLSLGEDLSYGNMVACPSAKWITRADPHNPEMPPMTQEEQHGIVSECFRERQYFLRQLFQSLPAVLMVFSQSTTDAFIGEMSGKFSMGNPQVGDKIADLINQEIRLRYGVLPDGTVMEARVIFSPHITGTPGEFSQVRAKVLQQLIDEVQAGRIRLDAVTGHLARPRGACTFCTTLQIGPCDYESQLKPLAAPVALAAAGRPPDSLADKPVQSELLARFLAPAGAQEHLMAADWQKPADPPATQTAARGWELSGDPARQP
jgi:hypothetical protein